MSDFSEPLLTPQDIDMLQKWRKSQSESLRDRFRGVLSKNGRVSIDDLEPMLDELMEALS